jgi:hypothetical protein
MSTIVYGTTSGNKFADAGGTLSGSVYRADGASDCLEVDTINLGTTNAVFYARYGSKQTDVEVANNADGTPINAPVLGDYGYSFNPGATVNQSISYPDSDALDITAPYCIEAWVKPADNELNGRICDKTLCPYIATGGTAHTFSMNAANDVGAAANVVTFGAWQHIAISWSGTNYRYWLNGGDVGSGTTSIACTANAALLYVGNRATGDRALSAVIDELKIQNVAGYVTAFTPYRFQATGTWSVVADSTAAGSNWTNVSHTATTADSGNYEGSVSQIRCRAGETNPPTGAYTTISSPSTSETINVTGRYIQVEFTLTPKADTNRTLTPKVNDVTLTYTAGVGTTVIPVRNPGSGQVIPTAPVRRPQRGH